MRDQQKTEAQLLEEINTLHQKISELESGVPPNKINLQIEEQVRKLSRAVEQSPVSIVITDTQGAIEYVNPKFTELTGYTLEEAIGQNPRILKTNFTPPERYAQMWETIRMGQIWRGEFCNRKKNGEIYWETASISPVLDENGKVTHFVAVKEDITAHKQAEQIITEALKFNQTILQASPIGITIYKSTGACVSANPAAGLIAGTSPEQLIQQNFHQIESWKKSGIYETAIKALAEDRPILSEVHLTTSFGKELWLNTSLSSFISGGEQHLLFIFEDISARKLSEAELRLAHEKLEMWVKELEQRNRDATILRQMGDLLQVCNESEEAYDVIRQFGGQLFPETSGTVSILNASNQKFEARAIWGKSMSSEMISTDECWALRRSHLHLSNTSRPGLKCKHMLPAFAGSYLDVPMMASGEAIGLFHLEYREQDEIRPNVQELAQIVAEHIALSLSNIKLREDLRIQSIRDPLTGVFNRRYMEETLARECPRATRKNSKIGIMMLDVDHFKLFNDTFGHEAGDLVLSRLGGLLRSFIRGEDIVCRFGGEEFILILPDASLEVTLERAEAIRKAVQSMEIEYNTQSLGTISISIGVAIFPEHGSTSEKLLQSADAAMYLAKRNGRNRVETAST